MTTRWRGRGDGCEDQVANARDSFVNLSPASEAPATQVRANWAALLLYDNETPIWEEAHRGRC